MKKVDLNRARQLANVFRFIDDLVAIDEGSEFEHTYKEIHHLKVELKKENSGNTDGSFLDLFINIEGNKFSINLF